MPFVGFEGPAGTGKTHELIETVRGRFIAPDIRPHQRILALTFMHGSRRRLDERLAKPVETRSRSSCLTIDSFAGHLIRRWQTVAAVLPNPNQFDEVCDSCGSLLERPEIARWVAASFPVIAIDEAQELKPCRLRIVKVLAQHADLYVAADEFQCLDESIDTAPFVEWFETGDIRRLVRIRRTGKQGLLAAGVALREGRAPISGPGLSIRYEFPNQMRFSVGHALNNARGSTAMLVAPGSTAWANELISDLLQGFRSARQVVNPVRIAWESGSSDEATALAENVCGQERITTADFRARLIDLPNPPSWLSSALSAVEYARRAHGRIEWSYADVLDLLGRKASVHRAFGYTSFRGVPAMSIHAGKNRQFRNVIVLWGPGVPGSPDRQRRLLYNAISRAEDQCTVFVRTRLLLNAPPLG
jgi:AAA domain/UvrD-like helicase C-terminal domain